MEEATHITPMEAEDVHKQFPSLFSGLGNFGDEYEVQLKPDAVPHAVYTPRHIPIPLTVKVTEELDRMEDMGVISNVEAHHGVPAWLWFL